jgi:NDP-sugar pyrophosphorylase family protein
MLDLKELLIMLGLAVGGPMPNQDMTFYRQKLSNEMIMEQKLQSEIKALEYRKMWDDVNKTEKTDFASNWLQEKKTGDKLDKHKKDLITTKKKIKVLKQIITKDSLEHIKIEPITL